MTRYAETSDRMAVISALVDGATLMNEQFAPRTLYQAYDFHRYRSDWLLTPLRQEDGAMRCIGIDCDGTTTLDGQESVHVSTELVKALYDDGVLEILLWTPETQGRRLTYAALRTAARKRLGLPEPEAETGLPGNPAEAENRDITLPDLLRLDEDARRAWMHGWMLRLNLPSAHQAAPVLCLSRSTVERMLYKQAQRTRITDQTLKIAWLVEKYGFKDSA